MTEKYWYNKEVRLLDKKFGRNENELFFKQYTDEERDSIRADMYFYFKTHRSMQKFENLKDSFHRSCADKFVSWYRGSGTEGSRIQTKIGSIIHALVFECVVSLALEKSGAVLHESPDVSVYRGDIWFSRAEDPDRVYRLELKSSNKCHEHASWMHLFIDHKYHLQEYKSSLCDVDYFLINNPMVDDFAKIYVMTKEQFADDNTKYSLPEYSAGIDNKVITRIGNYRVCNLNNLYSILAQN